MKIFKIDNISDEEYYANKAYIHYSDLSNFLRKGYSCFLPQPIKKKQDYFEFGQAVDLILTEGENIFERYIKEAQSITTIQKNKIRNLKKEIDDNPTFASLFKDCLPQLKFSFEEEGFKYRIKPDLIKVNEEFKVIQIIDVKTTFHKLEDFNLSMIDFNYYLQALLYHEGVKRNIIDSNYKLSNIFCFFVISKFGQKLDFDLFKVDIDEIKNIGIYNFKEITKRFFDGERKVRELINKNLK